MDSDSESQDSDDGRRFRFETTRKDSASISQSKKKVSPAFSRRIERRSRSRDRSSRDERSRHSKDDSSHRSRLSNDRDISSSRHSTKDRSSKDSKSSSRDTSSRRQHDKDSRGHRAKDLRVYESKDSRDSKDYINNKHKSKSREKHKKRSRDRSREKVSSVEEVPRKEEKTAVPDAPSTPSEMEEIKAEKQKPLKKHRTEDSDKVNNKSVQITIELGSGNPKAVSDIMVSQTLETVEAPPVRKKMKSFFDRVVNKRSNENVDSMYGPALPPQLERSLLNAKDLEIETHVKEVGKVESHSDSDADNQEIIGPSLPSNVVSSQTQNDISSDKTTENEKVEEIDVDREEVKEEEEEEENFGPALHPHVERRTVVGPMLPENFVIPTDIQDTISSPKSNDEDDDIVGPLPADHPAARDSYVQMQLEYRARQVKAKFRDKTSPEKNKHEEWMVELPPAHAIALGLGSVPRKFKTREGPDMSDRSMWTDTPVDRLRKEKEKEENRFVKSEESSKKSKKSEEKDAEDTVEEKKCESLLDMHLKNMKKKKKKLEKEAKELGLSTRRPFDRDIDLQVNLLNDARKKKIFEKASRLNDRFTAGKI